MKKTKPRISTHQRLMYAVHLRHAAQIVENGNRSWVDKSSMIILRALFPIGNKLSPDLSFFNQLSEICVKAKKP